MKFRNPWIDPRIVQVRPDDAKAYLLRHGWKALGPAINPLLLMFEGPGKDDETLTALVPLELDDGPMLQRMIDLVSELARFEERWAVDVLSDILGQPVGGVVTANGPIAGARAEPVVR
jgi:hypothetical protein